MVLSKSNMARAQAYNFELKLEWIWGKRYIAMKKQLSISNYKFIFINPAFWQHKMIVSVPVCSMQDALVLK